MRIAICSIAVISSVSFALAEPSPTRIPKFTTLDGSTYVDVTLNEADMTGLHIMHSSGAATIPWAQVPPDIKASVGYDPQKLAAAAKSLQLAAQAQGPKARIRLAQGFSESMLALKSRPETDFARSLR